uniref:Non-specific lipid-transfer protein n=1 Tax=Euphorbia lagascae TaxID=54672 RepID=Q8S4Y3_EUPLA|nr:lipid transfer protein 1 [Euphorbia lagascae]
MKLKTHIHQSHITRNIIYNMAGIKVAVLVVALMVVASGMYANAITCGQVSSSLAPCVNFLKSGGAPSPQCCNGLGGMVNQAKSTADKQAACNCLKTAAKNMPGLNPANAESLPSKCKVNIPYKISFSTNCNSIK